MCEGLFQYFSNIYTNRANRLDKTTIRMVNTYHDVHCTLLVQSMAT